MTTLKPSMVPNVSFPHAVLIPEGQYSHLPPIAVGRVLTLIGSEDTVHVRLRSRTISPVHAMLLNADGQVLLRDLASHTHVYVNSRLVRDAVLHAGDKIRVGRIRFEFQPGEPAAVETPPEPPPAHLWNQDGKMVSVKGPIFVIGRRRDTDLVVSNTPEPAHAIIFSVGGRRFLRHLKLSAPVNLNDHEIRLSLLDQGDVIEICGDKYQFTQTPSESDQANEPPVTVDISNTRHEAPILVAASESTTRFDSEDRSTQPEFDAGLSPGLSALVNQNDLPAAAGLSDAKEVSPSSASLIDAAASLVAETKSFDAAVEATSSLISEPSIAPQEEETRPRELEDEMASVNSQPFEPTLQEESWRAPGEVVSSAVSNEQPIPEPQPVVAIPADNPANDSDAPAIKPIKPAIRELPPKITDIDRAPLGLALSEDMLSSLKEWGPLAMAMLTEQRQDQLPEPPPAAAEETPPNRKWAWISMVAAITLALGVGAWLTLARSL